MLENDLQAGGRAASYLWRGDLKMNVANQREKTVFTQIEGRLRMSISGADLVVRHLEAQGVRHVFGVPGAKIDRVYDALLDPRIQTVGCRHEQNASFIAQGIGRLTGKATASRRWVWPCRGRLPPAWCGPVTRSSPFPETADSTSPPPNWRLRC